MKKKCNEISAKSTIEEKKIREVYIIKATVEHAEVLAEFRCLLELEVENRFLDKDVVKQSIEKLIKVSEETDGSCFYLIAMNSENTPIGWWNAQLEINASLGGFICKLHGIYITKDNRGQGIFKKIFQQIQQIARDNTHWMGVRISVSINNEDAQKVYSKLDMVDSKLEFYEN